MLHPFLNTVFVVSSAGAIYVAKNFAVVLPPELNGIFEGSATTALFVLLVIAIYVVRRDCEKEKLQRIADKEQYDKDREQWNKDRKDWEEKWGSEHRENLAAREKDRDSRDRLSDAINKLSAKVDLKHEP